MSTTINPFMVNGQNLELKNSKSIKHCDGNIQLYNCYYHGSFNIHENKTNRVINEHKLYSWKLSMSSEK